MIQDGDEMELDKGVLIQVGESMDKTETDLSPLFERRRAGQAGQASQGLSSQRNAPLRFTPSQSSQQSRSLNDLLGIKRTPIERLRPPYEQRQSPRPAEDPDSRPAKFQRTGSPEDVPGRPVVFDLEPSNKPTEPRAPAPATFRRPKVLGRPETYPRPPIPNQSTPTSQNASASAKPDPKSHSFPEYAQSTPQSSASKPPSSASKPPSSAPRNTLQLSKEKPRKKLMYRALLPRQANSETGSKSNLQAEPEKPQQ